MKKTVQNAAGDFDDDEPSNFDPSDPVYKVWCDCRVVPAFIFVISVQFVLLFAAFVFSLFQIVSIESQPKVNDNDRSLNASDSTPPSSKNSSRFEITFFLCQCWYPLIYFRVLVMSSVLFCIFVAFYGLKTAKIRCIKIYYFCVIIFVVFLLSYVALLAWHAIKNGDYFSFCFVGLTLLTFLLLNVSALHIATVLCKFMRSRQKFIDYAIEQNWLNDDYDRNSSKSHCFCSNLIAKYEISDDLKAKCRREISGDQNHRYRLCEIEEEDDI